MKLTRDDLYEIEKALDVYASYQVAELNKTAQICIQWEALRKESPLKNIFEEQQKSYDRIKEIRDKLQEERMS